MKPLRLKNMIAGCLLAAGALPVWGQSGAPTLVIRIDDLGALHSVNEACIQTYRSGIARSVEVMPVAAWYPEAIKMLKENPGLDVGLHLVITSSFTSLLKPVESMCPDRWLSCGMLFSVVSICARNSCSISLMSHFCSMMDCPG